MVRHNTLLKDTQGYTRDTYCIFYGPERSDGEETEEEEQLVTSLHCQQHNEKAMMWEEKKKQPMEDL